MASCKDPATVSPDGLGVSLRVIEDLLDDLDELEKQNAVMRKALEFYATPQRASEVLGFRKEFGCGCCAGTITNEGWKGDHDFDHKRKMRGEIELAVQAERKRCADTARMTYLEALQKILHPRAQDAGPTEEGEEMSDLTELIEAQRELLIRAEDSMTGRPLTVIEIKWMHDHSALYRNAIKTEQDLVTIETLHDAVEPERE